MLKLLVTHIRFEMLILLVVRYEKYSRRKEGNHQESHLSGIGEEFIAMQLDLEIPIVIGVLTELGEYKP